jgi:hypothetical protein
MPEKNKSKFPHFFIAPNEIFDFEKSDLSVYAKIVYLYICRCENNSKAFPSFRTIGEKCSISRNKSQDAVNELVDAGLIIKVSGVSKGNYGENKSNTYVIVNPEVPSKENDIPQEGIPIPSHGTPIPQDGTNKRTMKKESRKKELQEYIISENDGVFAFYSMLYKRRFGQEHPKMTKEKMEYLLNAKEYFDGYIEDELPDFHLEYAWEVLIEYHLYNLPKSNNGNILAFLDRNGGYGVIGRYIEEMYAMEQ